MKKLIISFCFLLFTVGFAQNSNFKQDYNSLITYLEKENWTESEQLSQKLLQLAEAAPNMQNEKMVLRYMYLYSNVGLLNENKISKEEALKKVQFLQGKEMIMPSHPFKQNCYNNCTSLKDDDKNTFFTGVNNKKITQILSFEYVHIPNGIKESAEELEGKIIRLKGILKEITVEGNLLPRYKLRFSEGEYKVRN
ncbi:hypothetical protein [Chryseobacterium sp. JUb7]|uniref:hypothetical protein n=1 Tax=Chryseobacterium sp. JUb7 TaxID=2940599 RepID=UPI0021684128|nr:hypothetical protein [Chryseobacterium sp. JUb7]MCS3529533.1 hypothetical protein [Chryseobacterium sp. JUb7]